MKRGGQSCCRIDRKAQFLRPLADMVMEALESSPLQAMGHHFDFICGITTVTTSKMSLLYKRKSRGPIHIVVGCPTLNICLLSQLHPVSSPTNFFAPD